MKEQAQKQLELISVDDIKNSIQKIDQIFSDSISINNTTPISREDVYNVKYKSKVVTRKLLKIKVPFDEVDISKFESNFNAEKQSDGRLLVDENVLSDISNYESVEITEVTKDKNRLVFPLEITGSEYSAVQRPNFIKELSFIDDCHHCETTGKVTCDDIECGGQHIYTCTGCDGKGRIGCTTCGETGKTTCTNCGGSALVKCGSFLGSKVLQFNSRTKGCNGSGKVTITQNEKKKSINCPTCRGKGTLRCEGCSRGLVVCSSCDGAKKVTCSKCDGAKKIECKYCDTNGQIECSNCVGKGRIATLYFVQTEIDDSVVTKSMGKGDSFSYDESLLKDALSTFPQTKVSYSELDENINVNDDSIAKEIIQEFREVNVDSKQSTFPRLLKEEIAYTVTPVVKIPYTHILTQSILEVVLVDIKNNVKMQKLGDATKVEKSAAATGKTVTSFFGKIFKTKKYKAKMDELNEVKLMIYLAKADGVMEESEKDFLMSNISSLENLTNKEKKELFALLSSKHLPALSEQKISFSSKEKGDQVVSKLEQLAQSDGSYDESEKKLIDEIKAIIK